METADLKPRAVIFDVYGTLLEVGPPRQDAETTWHHHWREMFGVAPRLRRLDFAVACSRAISMRHDAARALGIAYPEVQWPSVVMEVVPELGLLPAARREEFIYRQIQTGHSTRLAHGVTELLPRLRGAGLLLGIASNAQAYTLRELKQHLQAAKLEFTLFQPELCFWSFEFGFSKPDPHVFRILSARLESHRITPSETLMVGDRADNDTDPARRHGWQTWLLTAADASGNDTGSWAQLARHLL
jgi:putative hydrolase of the HAD superfamily